MPARKSQRVRGETVAALVRGLAAAADGKSRSLRHERLVVIESLGYVHRRRPAERAVDRGLGLVARSRRPDPPTPAADGLAAARSWRERRRRNQFSDEMASKLQALGALQMRDEPVPQQLWLELDRVQRARHLMPPVAPPGPGQFLRPLRPPGKLADAPATAWHTPAQKSNDAPPGPGPGTYLPLLEDKAKAAPSWTFSRSADARAKPLHAAVGPAGDRTEASFENVRLQEEKDLLFID
mmetsp:Transcript_26022/g.92820  ORF Transcript_26022/g.92820 Transcript_26022/m.92820 type:complete len:239 (+) Transcript_26022:73-789(+)